MELQVHIEKEALDFYTRYLTNSVLFWNGSVHRHTQDALQSFWYDGFTASGAARMTTNKHASIIKGLMEPESDSSEDDSSDSSSEHNE